MNIFPRLHPKERQLIEVVAIPLAVTLGVGIATSAWVALLTVGLFWVAPAWAACEIAMKKNRGGWWGFWLGWLGVVIAACVGYMPSEAERRVRELDAERQLQQLRG